MGREQSCLILYELDEQHEKDMGVWKQEKIWYLNTYYNPINTEKDFFLDFDRYYSLTEVKKDAIKKCED